MKTLIPGTLYRINLKQSKAKWLCDLTEEQQNLLIQNGLFYHEFYSAKDVSFKVGEPILYLGEYRFLSNGVIVDSQSDMLINSLEEIPLAV